MRYDPSKAIEEEKKKKEEEVEWVRTSVVM